MKTGPNTSFGPLVSFFIFISCFVSNDCIQVLFIYRKAYETTKTGPFISIFSYLRPPVCFFFSIYFILYFTNEYLKIDYPGMEMTRGRR